MTLLPISAFFSILCIFSFWLLFYAFCFLPSDLSSYSISVTPTS
jgi:hypothetical protein